MELTDQHDVCDDNASEVEEVGVQGGDGDDVGHQPGKTPRPKEQSKKQVSFSYILFYLI